MFENFENPKDTNPLLFSKLLLLCLYFANCSELLSRMQLEDRQIKGEATTKKQG